MQLLMSITGSKDNAADRGARRIEMLEMVSQSVTDLYRCRTGGKTPDIVVLLTGSTGSLGVNLLDQFCRNSAVEKVICLNRRKASTGSEAVDAVHRQKKELEIKGLRLSPQAWSKVEVLYADMQAEYFGLGSRKKYMKLVGEVTHIVHNAWPMDFQRRLGSFESQIRALQNLIDFSLEVRNRRPSMQPQLLFTSSIAVAGRSPENILAEQVIKDPLWTASMGYAEAKWVCEKILEETAKSYPSNLEPVIVRVGQLSGSTASGYWNGAEHIPTLVSASVEIGALPDLKGVSHIRCITDLLLSLTFAMLGIFMAPGRLSCQIDHGNHACQMQTINGLPHRKSDTATVEGSDLCPWQEVRTPPPPSARRLDPPRHVAHRENRQLGRVLQPRVQKTRQW
jgi:nucleoside-diphosphate-sugar epimerase